ncbi:MAG TPA: hypothetical protein VEK57_26690 [Thermoanaerobaculia bacterium]|nr:hypothetical protein [Thermoanaerobaculia bacterium]
MTLREATRAVTTANYRAPKTILGFFALTVAILSSSTVVVIGILARVAALHGLIIPVLVLLAGIAAAALGGVIVTAWKDPTILMLGQVSGEIYIANRKLTLGDSATGDSSRMSGSRAGEGSGTPPKTREVIQ